MNYPAAPPAHPSRNGYGRPPELEAEVVRDLPPPWQVLVLFAGILASGGLIGLGVWKLAELVARGLG